MIADVRTNGSVTNIYITTLFTVFYHWQTRTFLLKLNGWTDMKALENAESILNEALQLCEHTAQRRAIFFSHFGDALCGTVHQPEPQVLSDVCICQPACMFNGRNPFFQLSEEGNELILLLPLI